VAARKSGIKKQTREQGNETQEHCEVVSQSAFIGLSSSRSGKRRMDLALLRFLLELGFCLMTGGLLATDQ
jgi:hypothetical protein